MHLRSITLFLALLLLTACGENVGEGVHMSPPPAEDYPQSNDLEVIEAWVERNQLPTDVAVRVWNSSGHDMTCVLTAGPDAGEEREVATGASTTFDLAGVPCQSSYHQFSVHCFAYVGDDYIDAGGGYVRSCE